MIVLLFFVAFSADSASAQTQDAFFQGDSLQDIRLRISARDWQTLKANAELDTYYPAVHLLGTCRMGNDPRRSVVDRHHRAHDVPNLFIVDGSSFVTSRSLQSISLTIATMRSRPPGKHPP